MPVAWIYDLSKQQVEELASQLGLSIDGTPYLPSQSAAKSSLVTKPVQKILNPVHYHGNCLSKIKIKLTTD
jgi:hypothetical protein